MKYKHLSQEELILELEMQQKENETLTSSFQLFKEECSDTENTLRISEKMHRSLFEISFQGIVYQNKDGQILDANPAAQKILGLTLDQLQGRTSYDPMWRAIKEDGTNFPGHEHPAMISLKTAEVIKETMMGVFNPVDKKLHWISINACPLFNEGETSPDMVYTVFDDVTERIEIGEALKDSKTNMSAMINASDQLIILLSTDEKILELNDSTALRMGLAKESILGLNVFDLFPPDVAETYRPFFERAILSGKPVTFEDRRNDCWMLNNLFPILDDSGKVMRLTVYSRDITERKQAEEKLQQIHQNYETFFNTISDFLFVLDEQGNIVHTNSAVNERLGYTVEELAGKSVLFLHPPERREEAGRIVVEMLMGTAAFCPVPIITKSGIQIPVETKVKHGLWDGKPVIFGVSKDISKLKLSEEKFSKLFHINPSACGLSYLENHQYIEVNEAFYNLFGFGKDEVIGKTATELGILSEETVNAIICSADKHGNVINAEADLRAKNGSIKHTLLSSENIFVQDKKYRFTSVHDITDRIISEKALKKSEEELRQLNATKDKFFSIIAHDLKSPFNSIIGFSEMLKNEARNLDITSIQKYAGTINSSAQHTFELLENLLDWARMQQGRILFEPKPISFNDIVQSEFECLKETANKKHISLVDGNPENIILKADENMLRIVIRNLISNAIKFTPKQGFVKVSSEFRNDYVHISITDSGIGIKPETIGKLFKIETSFTTRGTENEKGTGLGLLLCKEFIEKHSGKIWVESEEGKGSTFSFSLPADEK